MTSTTARRPAPCSTGSAVWSPRSPPPARSTATTSTPRSPAARHPDAAVVVRPRSGAVPSDAAETAPTRRGRHLRCIAERGRMGWQRAGGDNWRALVEADISRWKRVIGDDLRFQADGRRVTEVAIAADVLNRMLDLGRPEYVRLG